MHQTYSFINSFYFYIFISLTLISLYILFSKNLLSIALTNSIFSLACALFYALIGAPDVALTESAVGVGLSTVLSLLTIYLTKPSHTSYLHININKTNSLYLLFIICLAIITFVIFIISLSTFPLFGNINMPAINETYFAYISQTYDTYRIKNSVTMILGSFRGLDTLGELLVIFIATIAVIGLLKQGKIKN